jgi:membrane-associated protease RseP (regulator of RpoE activity)
MRTKVLGVVLAVGTVALLAAFLYPKPTGEPGPAAPAASPPTPGASAPAPAAPRRRLVPERLPDTASPPAPAASEAGPSAGGRSSITDDPEATGLSGLELQPMDDGLREKLKVPKDPQLGYGVVVRRMHPDSPAAEASLEPNDVIVRADNKKVDDAAGLARLVGARDATRVTVSRDGQLFQVVLQKPFRR